MSIRIKNKTHLKPGISDAVKEATKEEIVQMNIKVPRSFYNRIITHVAQEKTNKKSFTVKKFIIESVEKYLVI